LDQGTLRVIAREEAIDRVLADLRVTIEEGTDIFTADFTAPDPLLAQFFVNELTTRYLASSVRDAQQEARRRRIFLEEQMTRTDSLLFDAQGALTQYRRQEGIFGSQNMIQAQQMGLMQLELRREELAAQARTLRSLSENLRTTEDESVGFDALISTPGMSDNLAIQALYDQLNAYQTQLDSMIAGEWGNATTHPDVERLRTLVANVQDKLRTAVGNHLAALEARIAALDELQARYSAALSSLPEAQAEESHLAQRVEGIRQLADQLRSEYQRARVEEAVEAGRIAIVDRASLPYRPVPQWKPLKVVLGLMGGLLAGTALAFLLELKGDRTIRRRSEVEALQVSALTVVPRLPAADGARFLPRRLSRSSLSTASSARFVTSVKPDSAGSEAYRMLGTTLRLAAAGGEVRTITVTSASPGDGKTTTALNLAKALASDYCRVRLIDGDRRNPRVHELFDAELSPGLTDVLVGRAQINEVIRSTSVAGLSVVTAGTPEPDRGELAGLPQLREAVRRLGADVDYVVVDSPPVLAVADAVLFAAAADGVLFVARVGSTERHLVRLAVQRLRAVEARVLGAVLNDPDDELAPDERVEVQYYGYYPGT
jgi:capsular exopolysaccharide synthesis family protein